MLGVATRLVLGAVEGRDRRRGHGVRAQPLQTRNLQHVLQGHGAGQGDRRVHRGPPVSTKELLVRLKFQGDHGTLQQTFIDFICEGCEPTGSFSECMNEHRKCIFKVAQDLGKYRFWELKD